MPESRNHLLPSLVLACVLAAGCSSRVPTTSPAPVRGVRAPAPAPRVVPEPTSITYSAGAFPIVATTSIVADASNAEVTRVAQMFAAIVRPSTGFDIPVTGTAPAGVGTIALRLADGGGFGAEGYSLVVTPDSIRVTANQPAGLFQGMQTLRQLLPPEIESHMKLDKQSWTVPAVSIVDGPRFAWRGAMLDVARHFFTVDEVEQYIDILALYKLNVLHLHLADDQGWRIEIKSRPRLTAMGSGTQVGGGAGGFYTQAEYAEIVRYAADRFITIVPEIDMPGHINAALIGYPEVGCSQRPPLPYTGTDVGWSTLCADKEETYALVDDIVREIAQLTPGRFFHMGGDENHVLDRASYVRFVERAQDIVSRYGKQTIGWEEIARARLKPTTIAQAWQTDSVAALALQYGARVILSPASRTYLDMKQTESTELGLTWAAIIEVRHAYDWDPATFMKGVSEQNIVGIEAPMWSETLRNITAVQYLAIPRLPALAEVGWTAQSARRWEDFRERVATHARRWNFMGINYYRSPQIPWPAPEVIVP